MTEEDHDTARERQRGQTAGDAPRRGPVIRTSDFASARPQQTSFEDSPVSERLARLARDPSIAARAAERERARADWDEALQTIPADEPDRRAAGVETAPRPLPRETVYIQPSGPRPVVDAAMVLGSAWLHRWVILALIMVMALLGGAASTLLPKRYTAMTTLYFDPQQVRFDDQAAAPSQEVVLAMIDSQAQILGSSRVLSQVAKQLSLDKDKEFAGPPAAVNAKLSKATVIAREDNTYVVNLSVKTKDPEKSAKIANAIVKTYSDEQESMATGAYDSTNMALGSRLQELGLQLKQAEQTAADFKAQNNLDTATATDPDQAKRTASLEDLLLAAQSKTIAAKARYDAVSKFQVADLVSSATPADAAGGSSNTLTQLQQQYGTAAANVSNLETKLGTRHPQLVAARATLQSVSAAIRSEITRMTTAAQADYERARAEEDAVAKELTVQKALDTNRTGPLIEYRELRRKADAIRDIYETVLKRSSQTNEQQRLVKSNVRVISPAEVPLVPDGPPRTILMIGCLFGGLMAGLMLGLLYAVIRLFITRARAVA